LSFLKDDKNRPSTARSIEFTERLEKSTTMSRLLFNQFSESIENTEVCQQNLKRAIEAEKLKKK